MFTKAIVRQPAKSLINGITMAQLGVPDFNKALIQHQLYIQALRTCGLEVLVLEDCERFPDSVFIEDAALLTSKCAVLARPGASTRKGEVELIRQSVETYYHAVNEIDSPGTLEAGDIMMVGSHFYIGLSMRTNYQGANQLIKILNHHAMTGSIIKMNEFLHLKTGLSYLENNNLLISGEFVSMPEFQGFNQIVVDENEGYAANSVWINGKVLTPTGYCETSRKIRNLGYEVVELEMSEFQKLDGGLSCLSLRF